MKASERRKNAEARPAGEGTGGRRRTILVVDDFPTMADTALQVAAGMAGRTGARLVVVQVDEIRAGAKRRGEIEAIMDRHREAGVLDEEMPVSVVVVDEDAVARIVMAAVDHDADLVVLADHGGLSRMGKTANLVACCSPRPVMIVREERVISDQ